MNYQEWVILIGSIMIMAVIVFTVVMVIRHNMRNQKTNKGTVGSADEQKLFAEPEITEMRVTVTDQTCRVTTVGIKSPKTVKEFLVFFEDDFGGIHKIPVSEEMYDSFEKGQRGILTLADGELYSFILNDETECHE